MKKIATSVLWHVCAALAAFCIGYIHHRWFYPDMFHGDAASIHVLAKAVLDEGRLLPIDFSYGNQVLFLRASLFIALAMYFGVTGYDAFALGSALSIAFWGFILYLFISAYFKSRRLGFIVLLPLLLPLGHWDAEYFLGQQSHLSNAILSMGIAISVHLYLADRRLSHLIAAFACLFVMTSEAPMRGLLVIAPILAATYLIYGLRKCFHTGFVLMSALISGSYLNLLLTKQFPLAINYFTSLIYRSSGEIFESLARTTMETVGDISSLNYIAGDALSFPRMVALAASLSLITCYVIAASRGFADLYALGKSKLFKSNSDSSQGANSKSCFLHITAAIGLVTGALAVATLNPDSSRHYLWAIFLIKLIIIKSIFNIAGRTITALSSGILIWTLALLTSVWTTVLLRNASDSAKGVGIRERDSAQAPDFSSELLQDLKFAAHATGIKSVYGSGFWHMMPINTHIENLNSQTLISSNDNIYLLVWVTRPSWACGEGDVLYYLKNLPADKEIARKLSSVKGVQIVKRDQYSIWSGPKIWKNKYYRGCSPASISYKGHLLNDLSGQVGQMRGDQRVTTNQSGFLVYGPYLPLNAGEYELTVHGSSSLLEHAYIDVASDSGKRVHARFNLADEPGGTLLDKASVRLPSDVSDLEIRIWVGESDSLALEGYTLSPVKREPSN